LSRPARFGGHKKRWDHLQHSRKVGGVEHAQLGVAVVGAHCNECSKTGIDRLEAQDNLDPASQWLRDSTRCAAASVCRGWRIVV
jgi:hypothetical protein